MQKQCLAYQEIKYDHEATYLKKRELEFEIRSDTKTDGDSTVFEKGDIAYWPKAGALCIFFGPTPFSTDDKPVTPYPMKKIGYIEGECSDMELSGDRQRMTMERSF